MAEFKNISIRNKLIIIQVATAFLAVLLCCGIFVYNNIQVFKSTSVANKNSIAEIVGVNEIILNYLVIAMGIMVASLLAAFIISAFLQRSITKRLLSLVYKTKEVTETGNYSVRVATEGQDEIGILSGSFNNMLEQIEN